MVCAANGVGKTCVGANILTNVVYGAQNEYFDLPLFQKFPYIKRGRIISDPTTIKAKIIPELEKWFPINEAKKMPDANFEFGKEGKNYVCKITTNTGWEIDLMSTEQDAKEFESADLGFIWIDEPMPKDKFMATLARARLGAIVVWTFTPLFYAAWIKEWMDEHADGEYADYVEAEMEDNCFGENTEVLTSNGWKDLDKCEEGQIVATYDINTQTIEYQPITSTIKKPYTGEMIEFGLGLLATPSHRMVVLKENGVRSLRQVSNSILAIQSAGELKRGVRMFGAAKRKFQMTYGRFEHRNISPGDWCEFLGWYLSEGCASGVSGGNPKKNQVYISQNRGAKKERIRKLLERMGLDVHERKGDLWFTDKEIHDHLLPLGNKYEKYIPRYIFNYPPDNLLRLWESAVLGDGDGKNRYITTSSRLADDLQELLLNTGRLSTVRTWHTANRGSIIKSKVDQFCVNVCINNNYYPNAFNRVQYDGTVSCVSVPNGTIIVRDKKEKYPLITGNCLIHGVRGILEHVNIQRMVDAFPEDEKQARAFGKFGHLIGKVHRDFRRKIHVIKPFSVDERKYTTYMALDPHARTPDHILYLSVDKFGRKYVTGEIVSEGLVKMLYERIKAFESAMHYRIETRLIDPSAYNDDQHKTERSIGQQLYDLGLTTFIKGSKDLMAGIKRTNDALHYELKEGTLIKQPELYVFDTCTVAIKQLENYVWQEWKGSSKDDKKLNAHPKDKDDHQCENLHRLLLHEPSFVPYEAMSANRYQDYQNEIKELDPYR